MDPMIVGMKKGFPPPCFLSNKENKAPEIKDIMTIQNNGIECSNVEIINTV
jgi:hypothetical protein